MLKRFTEWLVPGSRLSFWLHLLVLGLVSLASIHLAAWHEYRLGTFLMARHNYLQALPHLQRSLLVWPESVSLKLQLVRAERIAGSMDKAEEYLADLRNSAQALPELYRIEGLLLSVNRGYADDVEGLLVEYLREQHPESPAIYETLVMFNLKVRDLNRALFLLDQWQKLDVNNSLVYELRGNCLAAYGQIEQAMNQIVHALELNPDALEARLALCDLYFSTSKFPELAPHVRYLADHEATNRHARLIIARYLVELNRFDEADQQLASLLDEFPDDHAALVAQGTSYYRRNDFQKAAPFLRKAAGQTFQDSQVLYMLDRCLTNLNDPELPAFRAKYSEIKTKLNRLRQLTEGLNAAKRRPTQEELLERSQLYLQIGDENAGLRDLGLVIKKTPQDPRVYQIIVDYYLAKNDQTAAAPHLQMLEKLKKQHSSPGTK